MPSPRRARWLSTRLVAICLIALGLLAACGGGASTPAPTAAPQVIVQTQVVVQTGEPVVVTAVPEPTTDATDPNAPITVWIDSTREAAIKLYQQKHPDVADKIKIVLADRGQFPAKVLLFNNSDSGWPDVVFAEPEIVTQVSDASRNFPADLTPYISKDLLDKFAPGANAPCTFDGKLFCLRNDLAQNVLWYNKPLMDKFGYQVPTTWEEYEALGEQVAKDHPGYIIGAFGDDQAMNVYFWGSGCPFNEQLSPTQVRINLTDSRCTRAATMVDKLLGLGVLSKLGPFDPGFAKIANDNQLLLFPAASWYGEYVFGGKPDSLYYKTAEGQLGVALPPKWKDDPKPLTGAQGGSAWTMSRHTKNPKLAADLIIWLATSDDYQGSAPTFPAYLPAAEVWSKTVSGNKVYASDPFPILKESSGMIDGTWANVRYSKSDAFKTVVIGGLKDGKTVAATLPDLQQQLSSLAEAQGYEVVNQ
jgi:multiple sugar transport system substrate-binding protein